MVAAVAVVVVVGAMVGIVVISNGSAPDAAQGNPSAWVYTDITGENIAKAVDHLPSIVEAAMAETGVPGISVAVVRSNEVLLAMGFGVREVGQPGLVDADTVFQIASLSKPIGATVVSRAVSEGSVSWDDPIVDYLPWFHIGDELTSTAITLGDLYAHRSGLPDHSGDDLEDLGFERDVILDRLRYLPTGPFRDQYAYTNFGLTAAGEAVAVAQGTSWEALSEELLYGPAGMPNTSSWYEDYLTAENRAVTHQRRDGVWAAGPERNPQPESPAGGVSSTANDIARFLRLHLGNGTLDGVEMIDADVLQIMRQPQSTSVPASQASARSSSYGFGIGVGVGGTGQVRFSHSGAFLLGAATNFIIVPGGDIAIVVLTNGEPLGIPEAITAQFIDIVETGAITRDWLPLYSQGFAGFTDNPSVLAGQTQPASPNPAESLDTYAGTYANDYFGIAAVTVDGNELLMALGPIPQVFVLRHWDGDVFSYYPIGENAVGITAVTFDTEDRTMNVENLDENDLGTFQFAHATEF